MSDIRTWDELTSFEQDEYLMWVMHLVDEGMLNIETDHEIEAKARAMYECDVDKKRMGEPFSDIFNDLDIDFPEYL